MIGWLLVVMCTHFVACNMGRLRGGRNKNTAARPPTRGSTGSGASDKPDTSQTNKDGTQLCGTCDNDVGDSAIGCDDCEIWVHNIAMCSGLPQDMIDAISRYHGEGTKFVCTNCRLNSKAVRGSSRSGKPHPHIAELVTQLFQQMKGICSAVYNLTEKINT